MAPRLIRKRPLAERIKAYLDPVDFLLWLSEQLDSSDWENWQKAWATPIGVLLNFFFVIARANSGYSTRRTGDGVFGDEVEYTRWSSWFSSFVVQLLSLLSIANAAYAFFRRRHYRLFESSVNKVPSTPSAHRVKVNSSPVSSSPLRFLSSILVGDDAEARAHPDPTRDVWEIAVWDPTPISLRLFCFLSPGHTLVYWLFLPTAITDPRPSTTVVTAIVLAAILSIQLLLLCLRFSQQSKDASVIHKEVMNEYDIKYVHPRTQHLMRDVGTQFSSRKNRRSGSPRYDIEDEDIDLYTPTYNINKGFHTRPNPSYAHHVEVVDSSRRPTASRGMSMGAAGPFRTPSHLRDVSSPLQPQTAIRQPQFKPQTRRDGGSLGVYSHASSPLRKSASSNLVGPPWQRERSQSPHKRRGSPLKVNNLAALPNGYPAR